MLSGVYVNESSTVGQPPFDDRSRRIAPPSPLGSGERIRRCSRYFMNLHEGLVRCDASLSIFLLHDERFRCATAAEQHLIETLRSPPPELNLLDVLTVSFNSPELRQYEVGMQLVGTRELVSIRGMARPTGLLSKRAKGSA